jgi:hypothetical protein
MRRLVVVGNGMAGLARVEQILKHAPRFTITILGDETHTNYSRILLSSVLAGDRSADEITLNSLEWVSAERHPLAPRRARRGRQRGHEDSHRLSRQRHLVRHASARDRQLATHAAH